MSLRLRLTCLSAALALACTSLYAQDTTAQTAAIEKNFASHVTTKVLPNGLTLLICERPMAPVFSYYTLVDAGSANDPQGDSGLAHMFEHMAFKGTDEVGTTNIAAERAALAKVEDAYAAYDTEYRKLVNKDPKKLAGLHAAFEAATKDAQQYVVPNQFTQIAEEAGATGLNAETAEDDTVYYWSMPSNRLELWAYLESGRIGHPVLREFYKERDVVQEERRMRVDSDPIGRMVEQFLATAYVAHPYGRSGVGWESEISQVSATEAAAFHAKYYVPSNIVIAVVGDVKAADIDLLAKYFGAIPAGPKPEEMTTIEPPQFAEKTVVLTERTQPFYIEGYHRPDYRDPDDAVYDAISDIFSTGRTGRLYKSLVRDQHLAVAAEGFSGFPGEKYPQLFSFYAIPAPGHTPEEIRDAIHKEIDRLKNEDVTDEELATFKTRQRADLLRSLDDNQGIAHSLAEYQTKFGDWRQLFREIDEDDKVTKADIRRVANKIFVAGNRTSAMIQTQAAAVAPPPSVAAPPTQPVTVVPVAPAQTAPSTSAPAKPEAPATKAPAGNGGAK